MRAAVCPNPNPVPADFDQEPQDYKLCETGLAFLLQYGFLPVIEIDPGTTPRPKKRAANIKHGSASDRKMDFNFLRWAQLGWE